MDLNGLIIQNIEDERWIERTFETSVGRGHDLEIELITGRIVLVCQMPDGKSYIRSGSYEDRVFIVHERSRGYQVIRANWIVSMRPINRGDVNAT